MLLQKKNGPTHAGWAHNPLAVYLIGIDSEIMINSEVFRGKLVDTSTGHGVRHRIEHEANDLFPTDAARTSATAVAFKAEIAGEGNRLLDNLHRLLVIASEVDRHIGREISTVVLGAIATSVHVAV